MIERSDSTPSPIIVGIKLTKKGAIKRVCTGEFDIGHAEAMAKELILLASSIREAARNKIKIG